MAKYSLLIDAAACFAALLCLACAGFAADAPHRAEPWPADIEAPGENPLVCFQPVAAFVEPGALCTLQVLVDDAVDSLSCMEIFIAFDDTSVVELAAVYEGRLFKTSGYPTFFRWEGISALAASAVDCVLGYRSYFLAPGELVKFVFRAKAPGACDVRITSIRLWDIDRVELSPVAGGDARIVVRWPTGGGTPPPAGAFWSYPNPFNPSTVLVLQLPLCGAADGDRFDLTVDVYGISGEHIRSLFKGRLPAGRHELGWDGADGEGRPVAGGVYIAVACWAGSRLARKLVLVR